MLHREPLKRANSVSKLLTSGDLTWPRSLCSELQTKSHAVGTWWSFFGRNTCGWISAVWWQQCAADGPASPPAADTAPLSGKSEQQTHTETDTNHNQTVFVSNAWLIWPQLVHVYVSERAHLTDSQLIPAALDRTELVEHHDTVFSVCRWKIPQAKQGFIPVCTCSADTHTHKLKTTMQHEWRKCEQGGSVRSKDATFNCLNISLFFSWETQCEAYWDSG